MLSMQAATRLVYCFKGFFVALSCALGLVTWGGLGAYAQSTTADQVFVYDMSTDSRLYAGSRRPHGTIVHDKNHDGICRV